MYSKITYFSIKKQGKNHGFQTWPKLNGDILDKGVPDVVYLQSENYIP